MKKHIFFLLSSFVCVGLFAQSPQEALRNCLRQNPIVSSILRPYAQQGESFKNSIEVSVQQLIGEEQIFQENGVPDYENLRSVVRTATELAALDSAFDQFYTSSLREIVQKIIDAKICWGKLNAEEYQEEVLSYLEEEGFRPNDNYASLLFAKFVGFTSVRERVNRQVEEWLSRADDQLSSEDPALNQLLSEDFYWPLMNSNWDLNLRNPEPELLHTRNTGLTETALSLTTFENSFSQEHADKNAKLKDLLLFIFDNWKDIKDILNWLSEQVTYDCHGVTQARQKETIELEASTNPTGRRKAKYLVFQRGVLIDGKATKTHIKGIVHAYRKKAVGWGKDRINTVGVGYCSFQWNACENIPWMADGSAFVQAPYHRIFKASQDHKHPYALTLRNSGQEFLSFYFYFREQLCKTIYLLGSGNCM